MLPEELVLLVKEKVFPEGKFEIVLYAMRRLEGGIDGIRGRRHD